MLFLVHWTINFKIMNVNVSARSKDDCRLRVCLLQVKCPNVGPRAEHNDTVCPFHCTPDGVAAVAAEGEYLG